jgi:hypothetical protein
LADLIDRRGLFGKTQRVAERQDWTPVPIFMRRVRAAIALATASGAVSTDRRGC